jgi:hypothetical protein
MSKRKAFAYFRTSSAANVGEDKDSEKANLVAKLAAARKRTGRHGGQKSMAKLNPRAVEVARSMGGKTLRTIAAALAEQGLLSRNGTPFQPNVIARMLKARAEP